MQARPHFRIINFKHPSGTTVFRVTGCTRDGKQIRLNFRDEDAATLFAQKCEREYRGLEEPEMTTVATRLNKSDLEQAEAAIVMLHEALPDVTLTQAIKWLIANYRPAMNPKLLCEAVTDFIAEKEQALRSKATTQPLKSRCSSFAKLYPNKLVSDIKVEDVRDYVFLPAESKGKVKTERKRTEQAVNQGLA